MKLLSTNAGVPFVTISISIIMALVPTDVNAFAVHAQKAGVSLSHVHDSTGDARHHVERHTSSLDMFNRNRHHKTMPTTATKTALSVAALPSLGHFAAAAFLPTCLGLWRTGYAVSYAYGGSMAAAGLIQLYETLRGASKASLPLQLHAALYVLYGVRLCGFLLHREIRLPVEIHKMTRRDASISERLKRLPVITGCSVLWYCMAAGPMRVLALSNPKDNALTMTTLAVGFVGFLLAAVGDWYKCKIKGRDGPQTLVTSGPFRYFRHPNYTGEIVGWTCLCLLLPLLSVGGNVRRVIPWLLTSILGWAGIVFQVLIGEGTVELEQKHKEKYGGTQEYEKWIKTSWSGPMLGGSDK